MVIPAIASAGKLDHWYRGNHETIGTNRVTITAAGDRVVGSTAAVAGSSRFLSSSEEPFPPAGIGMIDLVCETRRPTNNSSIVAFVMVLSEDAGGRSGR